MYQDEALIFAKASDPAATATAAVSLLQGDHPGWPGAPGKTNGSAPYQGLYLVVKAGEDIASTVAEVITLQHCDTQAGTYATLLAAPAQTDSYAAGDVMFVAPIPHRAKNWLKVALSTAKKIDAFLTNAVDRHYPGVWDGSAD
jgi:hypothetical protein